MKDQEVATKLFEYLRDILYNTEHAELDTTGMDGNCLRLAEGMKYFGHSVRELREFSTALARGNLSIQIPPQDNELAAPLKALHASLRHLTWQTQQVAKGDYQQRVDFMGDFAEAFNSMTEQLNQRQRELQAEIEKTKKKSKALEQNNSLLEAITNEIQQWIIVVDQESGEILFQNRSAEQAMQQDEKLAQVLRRHLTGSPQQQAVQTNTKDIELTFGEDNTTHYFSMTSYPMHWREQSAVAQVFIDVSAEKRQVQRLENYAYQDTLTGLHNRFYGMNILSEWLDKGKAFCICFADLDNLKYVNDNFGHSEGDRYIITAAELLNDFSSNAVVSRIGGDEFMVLADKISCAQAMARMQRIRSRLMEEGKQVGKTYLCSLSYGIVDVEPNTSISSGDLLSLADDRMYAYKRAHKLGPGRAPVKQKENEPAFANEPVEKKQA